MPGLGAVARSRGFATGLTPRASKKVLAPHREQLVFPCLLHKRRSSCMGKTKISGVLSIRVQCLMLQLSGHELSHEFHSCPPQPSSDGSEHWQV